MPKSRLVEYDEAGCALAWEILHSLMGAQDPLLGEISREPVDELPTEGAPPGVAVGACAAPIAMRTQFVERVECIANTDVDAWAAMVHEAATEAVEQLMPQFFDRMGDILREAGQEVDAKGGPLTVDLYLDGIEKVDLDFDEDGKPLLPRLVLPADLAAKFQALEWTEEHKARFERLMNDKRKVFDARRRVRRLD